MFHRGIIVCAALLTASCAHRFAVIPTATAAVESEEEAEVSSPGDIPLERPARQEYFKAQRLTVDRLTKTRELLGTAAPAASSSTVNPQRWTFIGPQPMVNGSNPWAGSVLILAIDPHNASTIYAVTFLRRLWKTTDAGTTWLPLSDAGPLVSIQWLALDPVLTNTLYAMDAGSLYKSTNGGSTWAALPPVVNNPTCLGEAFAIHPAVSGTWLVSEYCSSTAETSALYRTTNSGASWSQVSTINGEISEVEFNTGTPTYAYASGFLANAVLFEASTDSGSTWTRAVGTGATQLPQEAQNSFGTVRFAAAPTDPKTIYLRTETYTGEIMMNLYKSADGGATWNITGYTPEGQGPRTPALTVVDPTNANIVYAGSLNVHRSTNGGAMWTDIYGSGSATQLHTDNHAMAFTPDGNTAYESNDGGVWSSTNFRSASAPTWTNLNNTFGTAEFEPTFGMDPTNPNRSFGGLQDNSTVQYSGTLGWSEVGLGGDGNGNAINPQNPQTVYSVDDSSVNKSTAGGAPGTWVKLLPVASGGRLTMDFTTPNTLYYHLGTALMQTQDGGNTWPTIATMPAAIAKVAVAPSTSNTVVAMAEEVAFVSNNALSGANAKFTGGLPVSGAASVSGTQSIVIDPTDPAKFYSLQDNGSASVPLLVSSDGGMSWQARNLGPNVTDAPTDLAFDPDLPNTMYLGTKSSVFRSSDGGGTWWPLASGFPIADVTSVNLHHSARILRVATAGRGAWDLAIPTTAPRVSSASLAAAKSGYLLTVSGSNFTSNSAVWLNGTPVTTTFSKVTELTATVPPSSITPSTVYYVSVNTPGSGGGLSDPVLTSIGPTIYPNGVQNGAGPVSVTSDSATNSFAVGLSPGMIVTLFGSELAATEAGASLPLPTTLDRVQVLVNGTAAPIYYISASEIDFAVPWETAGSEAAIAVVSGGTTSNTISVPIQIAPQIFTLNNSGSGQGSVVIAGTDTIAAPIRAFPGSSPAAKGDNISIYTTGLGGVLNPPADGVETTGPSQTLAQPAVNIGCLNSSGMVIFCNTPIQSSSLVPGFVGLYQVNVQIPANAMSGSAVPLELTFGPAVGRPSNIVTIAVK